MSDAKQQTKDSTETLIESLHASRKKRTLLINPDYLDDEKLPEDERSAVLKEIFNKNIREKAAQQNHISPHTATGRRSSSISTDIRTHRLRKNSYFDACALNL